MRLIASVVAPFPFMPLITNCPRSALSATDPLRPRTPGSAGSVPLAAAGAGCRKYDDCIGRDSVPVYSTRNDLCPTHSCPGQSPLRPRTSAPAGSVPLAAARTGWSDYVDRIGCGRVSGYSAHNELPPAHSCQGQTLSGRERPGQQGLSLWQQ